MSDTTVKDTESEYQIDSTQPVIFTSKGKISLSIINEALHYIKSRQIELDDFVVFTKSEFKTLQNKLTKISEPSSIRHWRNKSKEFNIIHEKAGKNYTQDQQMTDSDFNNFQSIEFYRQKEYNTIDNQYDSEIKPMASAYIRDSRFSQ